MCEREIDRRAIRPFWNSGAVQIAILGPLQVRGDDGCVIPVAGARLRRLLTRLALDAGRAVAAADLVDAVWLDDPPQEVANALQSLVSRLRRVLGDPRWIQQAATGYRLDTPRESIDVHTFAAAVTAGRRALQAGDPRGALALLTDALRLWRGAPLCDADAATYATAPTARWDELRLAATADRIAAEFALGNAAEMVPELEELVAAYPLREQFVGQLMTALAATARTADALAAYEQLRTRLADLLGADPGKDLQAAHLALLRGDAGVAPAPAPALRRSNLRAAVSSFVGRELELARVTDLVAQGRLTTIVGPGGAGKTRLAMEAASPLVQRYRDGVWLVELAPVSDGASIAQTVLGAFGLRDARILERRPEGGAVGMSVTDRVLDTLVESDALLVVDNCEHLIGAAAEFVELLLARCPDVRVLATSREPLGLPGEALVSIPPLGLPPPGATPDQAANYPAVKLLLARGEASRSGFALTAATVGPVIDVVRRLDGLPLAIELAAARLRVLPVAEIAERLSDRFRLLAGGVRTSVARHRTLRAVVEWSWELLSDTERLLFERLAIFPAGATAASAVHVCGDERLPAADIPDLLLALVDKSLLQVVSSGEDGAVRYRMLETIREYGTERLDERGELADARARHAHYFAGRAHALNPTLRTAEQLVALAEFAVERDNLLAAVRYLGDSGAAADATALVLDLCWYWNITGGHSEMATWTQFVLDAPWDHQRSADLVRVQAAQLLALIAGPAPAAQEPWLDLQSRLTGIAEKLSAIDDGSDPLTTMMRMYTTFFAAGSSGFDDLYASSRSASDPWLRAMASSMRVFMLENDGEVDQLPDEIHTAYSGFEELGDRWGMAQVLTVRAGVRSMDGDVDGAVSDFQLALEYLDQLGATEDDMIVQLRLAGLRLRQGDFAAAHRHVQAVRTGRPGVPVALERALLGDAALVGVLLVEGDLEQAERRAGELRRRIPGAATDNPIYGHLHAMIGSVCAATAAAHGDTPTARADLAVAYPAAVSTGDRPLMASTAVSIAAYAVSVGRPEDGAEILGAAAALRGGDDDGDVGIARVREQLLAALDRQRFDAAYAAGRSLGRDAAAKRVDPALLDDADIDDEASGRGREPRVVVEPGALT